MEPCSPRTKGLRSRRKRPPPSGFYFTNYFICLELFQLDLGPVSKRANTAALAVVASLGAAPLFVHHQRQRSTTDATATL